jgi:ATP-dependent helicase/nuclease subunit B
MGHPRLYTIPSDAAFLDTLAQAVLNGNLPVMGGTKPDPLELGRWTILLPTRRAVRALGDAFLRMSGGEAILVPQIRAIGDVEEDALALTAPPELGSGNVALDLPPAIGNLERRLALTQLILAWSRKIASDTSDEGYRTPATPAQASSLATQLGVFMDAVDTEHAELDALKDLVPDQFAEHWQKTLKFLKIVTEYWPAHLDENGVMAPYARRDALMAAETERLTTQPPDAPVIAAGSTATAPATAALLEAVARLENGAVILPGLDPHLDEESWEAITEGEGHPEHPQFGMRQFLVRLGVARDEVLTFGGDDGRRARLLSEVMRPAGTTEKWQALAETADCQIPAKALDGLRRIDAPTEQDEAEVISLLLRSAAEEPQKVAALVTPDRTLARRVSARLEKWGLTVDDSAGKPLEKTLPGSFMDALAETADSGFAPVPLLALLKHPLTLMGREAGDMRRVARHFELVALRQPAVGRGFKAYRRAMARTRDAVRIERHVHPGILRLGKGDWDDIERLVSELEELFAPLTELSCVPHTSHPLCVLVEVHLEAAQALTRAPDGSVQALWRSDAGEALHGFVCSLLDVEGGGIDIAAGDYLELMRNLMSGLVVRPQVPAHPRIFIWGPLEARLLRPDMVVLGGLNEGAWPATIETDPWLSRPMRAKIGLSPPERHVGLSAHDVAQLLGAGEVWLTRAQKSGGAPTVASRWLLRLDAVLDALNLKDAIRADETWLAWARARDAAQAVAPVPAPAPCPPLEARPTRLSVTRIEAWIRNPYEIFARDILRLYGLAPLAGEPDAALRGTIVHLALMRFTRAHPGKLPNDIAAALMRHASDLFKQFGDNVRIRAFWECQIANFARWFAATESRRRGGVEKVLAEVRGELAIEGTHALTLSAEADRIDVREDGTLALYDYKTGAPPTAAAVEQGRAPQLPLEAVIAAAGGFDGVEAATVSRLAYLRARGYGEGGEERDASKKIAPDQLAGDALERLKALVAAYASEEQSYAAMRRPKFTYRYDDYAHLARVQEWQAGNGVEE